MGGPRRVTNKTTTPRPGSKTNNSNKNANNRSKKNANSQPAKGSKKGKGSDADGYDVFDAGGEDEDNWADRRRNLERIAVRDYEIENIDSEDDEEIDSDDAFNESDEERFGGYALGKDTKADKSQRSVRFDDEVGEQEEEDEDGMNDEEMVDLSEMLDASGSEDGEAGESKPQSGSSKSRENVGTLSESTSKLSFKDLASGYGSGDSEADEDIDSDDEFANMNSDSSESFESDSEVDSDDAERLSKLDNFVSSISARAPKRRFVAEAGGGFAEDENTVGSGLNTKGVSLGINDLLGSLGGNIGDQFAEDGESKAAREIRILRDQVRSMEKTARKSGSGVVAAPIAKRLQDQMDRKVAYSKAKKEISEWQPAIDANRTAEHLSFPMNAPAKTAPTSGTLIQDVSANNDMEEQIQSILEQSGMTDTQQRQYEELELKKLSPDEVRSRQRELRLMRELMFRSEQKAKRMAKIKSKAYRRILKKDKARAEDKALEKLKEDDPEMYAMVMDKMAQSRAEERMTLRHKNTSKWAREMSKRSHGDSETQEALRDQLDQHDELKRKIYDVGSDEELSDYEAGKAGVDGHQASVSGSEDDDESFSAIKKRAASKIYAEIASLQSELPDGAPHKALFEMKFMQNAMQRKREQTLKDAQMMRDEFDSLDADIDDEGNVVKLNKPVSKATGTVENANAPGRMSFGGGLKKRDKMASKNAELEDGNDGEERDDNEQSTKRVRLNEAGQIGQVASNNGHRVRLEGPMSVDDGSTTGIANGANKKSKRQDDAQETPVPQNPWLSEEVGARAANRSGKSSALSKESTRLDKLSARLREKRLDIAAGGRAMEENVLLDANKTLSIDRPKEQDDSADDSASDDDSMQIEHLNSKNGQKKRLVNPNAFTQRELVEQAFAEDDVVEAEFAAEKEAIMDEEAPKDQDLTLPGWGSWGGIGLQPKKSKIVQKTPEGSGVEKSKRKDAKMGSVIINHKQLKAANKYYASNVPFPFYTPEQYEETLQAPLGKEWNTAKSYSKMIKPRVLTKAGRIIDPLTIPSKKRQ
ncbi:Utp14 protein-domain-containing protein [Coemansia spiralis]|nr:Utp14 protein-domain-containing protein [Coemansia spiralis]